MFQPELSESPQKPFEQRVDDEMFLRISAPSFGKMPVSTKEVLNNPPEVSPP